jgi:hypothetical protein
MKKIDQENEFPYSSKFFAKGSINSELTSINFLLNLIPKIRYHIKKVSNSQNRIEIVRRVSGFLLEINSLDVSRVQNHISIRKLLVY